MTYQIPGSEGGSQTRDYSISRAFRLLRPPLQLCLPILLCGPFLTTTLIWSCVFGLKDRNLAEPIEAGVSALGLIETVCLSELLALLYERFDSLCLDCCLSIIERHRFSKKKKKELKKEKLSRHFYVLEV